MQNHIFERSNTAEQDNACLLPFFSDGSCIGGMYLSRTDADALATIIAFTRTTVCGERTNVITILCCAGDKVWSEAWSAPEFVDRYAPS